MRIDNWDVHLVDFAGDVRRQGFKWGETDCASLTRRALTLILDRDPWDGHVGNWTTLRGARRVQNGLETPQAVLRATGAEPVDPPFATSGDVVLMPGEDDSGFLRLGIIVPVRKVLTSTPELGVHLPDALDMPDGTEFWRYG